MRKLYKAVAEVVVFYEADEETAELDGEDYLQEAVRDNGINNYMVYAVTKKDVPRDGWDDDSLVYGAEGDLMLGDALAKLEKP